jgi:transcriptional regulator with XRE-family HTH domain
MQLAAYLKVAGISAARFAEISGIGSRMTVHNYVHGQRFPSPKNLLRIRVATGSRVTADDFVDQHTAVPAPPGADGLELVVKGEAA